MTNRALAKRTRNLGMMVAAPLSVGMGALTIAGTGSIWVGLAAVCFAWPVLAFLVGFASYTLARDP